MRIERVVAGSFAEASEISKREYGSDVLLLSSSRVGNSHELLICLEGECSAAEANQNGRQAGAQFGSMLTAEFTKRTSSREEERPVDGRSSPTAPVVDQSVATGAALVATIREELRALEFRLSSRSEDFLDKQAMFALLEQGISAAYATHVMQSGAALENILERFVQSIRFADLNSLVDASRVSVFGPASSGRTTLSLQVAQLLQGALNRKVGVCAERDPRPGARERFFSIADTTDSEVVWGAVSEASPAVVDVGGDGRTSLSDMESRSVGFRLLCLPSFYSRASAAHIIGEGSCWDGVCLTFWSDHVVPLGLMSLIAERNIPLIGVSPNGNANTSVRMLKSAELSAALRGSLSLALNPGTGCLPV